MVKVVNVVGARPNFIKMAPIIREMAKRAPEFEQLLVHTGQHYDEVMSGSFFSGLGIPAPDVNLNIGSDTHAAQTARIMLEFEPVLLAHKPDWLVVVGDVNSTIACTLVASKLGVKVAHVESGLRSFDRSMPEEINRVLTDRISDLLLTPSPDADKNLLREGIEPYRIARVGNVMIDTLHDQLAEAEKSPILDTLSLKPGGFAVLTLHRPGNVDDPDTLRNLFSTLATLSKEIPILFPAHPRTQNRMREIGLNAPEGMIMTEPMGYTDFLQTWRNSRMVLTDSGGLQEETTALGVPCLTLRPNTERPITIEQGSNHLVGLRPDRILSVAHEILSSEPGATKRIPPLWDGRTAERIVDAILNFDYRTPDVWSQKTWNPEVWKKMAAPFNSAASSTDSSYQPGVNN